MTGDNAANAVGRDWIAGFDMFDDFIADIVGVVALGAGIDVLTATPMVVAIDDNDAHGLNFFGQFVGEGLPNNFAFEELFGGAPETGQVVNDRRRRVAGELAWKTNQCPALSRIVEWVGCQVCAGELDDVGRCLSAALRCDGQIDIGEQGDEKAIHDGFRLDGSGASVNFSQHDDVLPLRPPLLCSPQEIASKYQGPCSCEMGICLGLARMKIRPALNRSHVLMEHRLKHVVFGSTAEHVVRHATCPVLTVRKHQNQFIGD